MRIRQVEMIHRIAAEKRGREWVKQKSFGRVLEQEKMEIKTKV